MTKQEFFSKAIPAAKAANHVWPEYAACEAALESAWGSSRLARMANNLFGQKKGFTTADSPTISIPTKEWDVKKQEFVVVDAAWAAFPDWQTSFAERMELLRRASVYHPALEAHSGEQFVREVSRHWATDPERGDKVLNTYRANQELIAALLTQDVIS